MLSLFRGSNAKSAGLESHQDLLVPESIRDEAEFLLSESGIPGSTVDSCAYDPLQKLLALGTSDGRVKLFGKLGIEKTLYSSARKVSGTRQLLFLPSRGVLLRIAKVRTGGYTYSPCDTVMQTQSFWLHGWS